MEAQFRSAEIQPLPKTGPTFIGTAHVPLQTATPLKVLRINWIYYLVPYSNCSSVSLLQQTGFLSSSFSSGQDYVDDAPTERTA